MLLTKFAILAASLALLAMPSVSISRPVKGLASATPTFSSSATAELIQNTYNRDEVEVADVVCDPEHGYSVDSTGVNSSTIALQAAIDDCYAMGGGTVYLPAGSYKIQSRIDLKPYVNLVGDYVDPDMANGDYGTVIVSGLNSTSEDTGEAVNLFRMEGSTAIIGLTFFYPDQYMDYPMPYGYAIEIPGGITTSMHTVFTIKDVTFLNAYKGICASWTKSGVNSSITHEQLHLKNIKGTVLREGAHLTNSSEVGTFSNIAFSSKYWAKAGSKYNAPNAKNIIDFTSKNGIGLILGDLEWQEIRDITIEDYQTGIYFTDGDRATTYAMAFIGSLRNITITGSVYGVYVAQMYVNMGIQFVKSRIEGSLYSIINQSPDSEGHVQLSGVKLVGDTGGTNIFWDNNYPDEINDIEEPDLNYVFPKMTLFNVLSYGANNRGSADTSVAIQTALDDAHANSGGVVYLPAGYYRLDNPLTVYADTLLRGCNQALTRDLAEDCRGTFIIAYYGANETTSDSGQALITLSGDNAGVSGFRVAYPAINMFSQVYTAETLPKYNFTIRGLGNHVYAVNLYLEGVYNGVDFSTDCSNVLISKVMGAFYHLGFKVGGDNAVIDSCLQNSIAICKINPATITDFQSWGTVNARSQAVGANVYAVTRYSTTVMSLIGATNAKINNVFSFASNTFIKAVDSSFTGSNYGMDSQPNDSGNMFELINSTAYVFNTLRDACSTSGSYLTKGADSSFTVYNRITLLPNAGYINESNIIDGVTYGSAKLTGADVEIPMVWKQGIDYTYVEYPNDPEPPVNPPKNDDWILPTAIVGSVALIGSVMFFAYIMIQKNKRRLGKRG